jgi:WD40 repeat protein
MSSSDDKTIQVWDIETGKASATPLLGHTEHVLSVAILADRKGIVSVSADESIRMWNVETLEPSGISLQSCTQSVLSVTISLDGNCIWFRQRHNPGVVY